MTEFQLFLLYYCFRRTPLGFLHYRTMIKSMLCWSQLPICINIASIWGQQIKIITYNNRNILFHLVVAKTVLVIPISVFHIYSALRTFRESPDITILPLKTENYSDIKIIIVASRVALPHELPNHLRFKKLGILEKSQITVVV